MKAFTYTYFLILTIGVSACYASSNTTLSREDLTNVEKVTIYRTKAPKKNIKLSNTFYQNSLTHKDPGSSVKLLLESIVAYPSSRAYHKLIEFQLKQYHYKDDSTKTIILKLATQYTHVALKLNEIDALLPSNNIQQLNSNNLCIKEYLNNKKVSANCQALKWIKISEQ